MIGDDGGRKEVAEWVRSDEGLYLLCVREGMQRDTKDTLEEGENRYKPWR